MISDVVDLIKSEHTYSVPEIIAVPITGGSTDYLKWVKESTKKKKVNVIITMDAEDYLNSANLK